MEDEKKRRIKNMTKDIINHLPDKWTRIGNYEEKEIEKLAAYLLEGYVYPHENVYVSDRQEISRLRVALENYGNHDRNCILSFWEAGEPTENGGYRVKYKGKWYQAKPIDETPKCNCGFDEVLAEGKEGK